MSMPRGPEPPARRLRVLEVVGNITLAGGAQRQVLEVVRRLPRDRFGVDVVFLQPEGDLAPRFRDAGAAVHDHTARGAARAWDPYGILRTASLLRTGRFDVVHAHLSRAEIVTTLALALADRRVPFVVHKHNEDSWWRRWPLTRFHAAITRRARVLVAPSERVVEFFRGPALRVADPGRFRVIPFGRVSPEPPPRERAREAVLGRLGLSGEARSAGAARVLLAAGRLVPQKRHDILLEAFARVAERHPRAHLAIAGNGALEAPLRERAAREDLAGRVTFLGLVDDLPTWLAGCDLFVNSSEYEGLPLVVLDAMAARAPIVATRVSGVPDCIVDGETGRLVAPGDPVPLAAAMADALDHPEQARAWGDAARSRVEERFSMDRAAERWAALYEELVAAG